jgi:hypothetical protein
VYKNLKLALVITALLSAAGCSTVYYNTMEAMGKHKRDLMVDRVTDAKDAQQEAKEQFKSALEQFAEVMDIEGGKLEEKYNKLNGQYEKSLTKAKAVTKRIADVESVSKALFKEWQKELGLYTSDSLRNASQKQLTKTQARYEQFINAMKRAEQKISPVLSAFQDQVLFLKHNLNAQAIASIDTEMKSVKSDIAALIKEMETSIAEANSFITSLNTEATN